MNTATANTPATPNKQAPAVNQAQAKAEATTQPQEPTFEQLLDKMKRLNITPDERKLLDKKYAEMEKAISGRKNTIAEIIKMLGKDDEEKGEKRISLSELVDHEAFTKEDIKTAHEGFNPRIGKSSGKRGTGTNAKKDHGQILMKFKAPKANGRSTTLATNTAFPAVFGASYQWLKDEKGELRANFMKLAVDDAAKAFLKTKEGEAWADKWIGWISRGGKKA